MTMRIYGGAIALALAFAMTAGCSNVPEPLAAAAVAPADACATLARLSIARTDIGLPTNGATVTGVSLVAAKDGSREYCKVLVRIASVDAASPPINMQINLPSDWNRKAFQMGGGGFDGFLVTGEGPVPGAAKFPTPLSKGFVTFGSDGGHGTSEAFAAEEHIAAFLHDEVIANYTSDQLKKTHDVAMRIVRTRYGALPEKTYIAGGSNGGRETLDAIQRWGADYDGAIAYYPAAAGIPLAMNFGKVSRAMGAPGAFVGPAQQEVLRKAVLQACDAGDGLADGIIANTAACHFDVETLRCPQDQTAGPACLTGPQIDALKIISSDTRLTYSLAGGETTEPGYNVFGGVDMTLPVSGFGMIAPAPGPVKRGQSLHYMFYDVTVRGWILRDPVANSLDFDPFDPGASHDRVSQISAFSKGWKGSYNAFHNHGGKLILVHGKNDSLIPVGWSENHYREMQQKMGTSSVNQFVRFYSVPGYGHGDGAFIVNWDSLSALDNWVENGRAPQTPVASDANPLSAGRTRPLCEFPSWPSYNGTGSANDGASFTCR